MDILLRELSISELKPNMVLGKDVKSATGQIIATSGTVLTPAIIARFGFYKISSVHIAQPVPPQATPPAPKKKNNVQPMPEKADFKNTEIKREDKIIRQVENIVVPDNVGGVKNPTYSQAVKQTSTFRTFESEFAFALARTRERFEQIMSGNHIIDHREIAQGLGQLASICPTSIEFFDMLHNMRQNNDSVYAHCLNAALIARQMGVWLHMSQDDLTILTVAGLLHDIGKLKIAPELLNKKGRLTDDEFAELRKHPIYSHEILKTQILDVRIKKAAVQHHERCDGSGYPYGLTGDEIDDFSVIIAIADVYDAMTAARVYRSPLCPFQVIAEFEKDGYQKYRPKYILTFLEHIAKTYQNNRVLLSNGTSANIVLLNNKHLSQPVVQLNDGSCIDLSTSQLYIKALI